nr:hypothetical protein [Tanacetum cinerariifolium]
MVNLPPPNNDPNVPEGDQAPAAPDRFASQWIGEHDPSNNNGWIEWDVPLGGEVDESVVDPEFDEEEMDDDDDDLDDDVEWLIHGVLMRKIEEVSDAKVGGSIAIEEIHLIVATVEEQVHTLQTALHGAEFQNQQLRTRVAEMESHEGSMMSYMLWMEERLSVLEKRLPGPPPGPQ